MACKRLSSVNESLHELPTKQEQPVCPSTEADISPTISQLLISPTISQLLISPIISQLPSKQEQPSCPSTDDDISPTIISPPKVPKSNTIVVHLKFK